MPSSEGFTLIELIVVIAILGILIAIAIPTIRGFLESSREQAYEANRRVIQLAVDAYYYSPNNERFNNERQYPIMGKRNQNPAQDDRGFAETHTRLYLEMCGDADASDPIKFEFDEKYLADSPLPSHPVLGARGGTPTWKEGTGANLDGLRNSPSGDRTLLYCPPIDEPDSDSDSAESDSDDQADHWLASVLTPQGTECNPESTSGCFVISSRDYLIDFCELVWGGFIEEVPRSASIDHDHECIRGGTDPETSTATGDDRGSYTWFVDSNGRVESLYFFLPTEDRTGYRDAYP
ncbi:MAG: prepilin-type N-terminal cleavage/methylation domain-containing protein [Chloroflexi bacterium]|nr:prepilin-type N-terminal cleavage/methylation domain-containing protein [Chloroflexota bacterium]